MWRPCRSSGTQSSEISRTWQSSSVGSRFWSVISPSYGTTARWPNRSSSRKDRHYASGGRGGRRTHKRLSDQSLLVTQRHLAPPPARPRLSVVDDPQEARHEDV